MLSLVAILLAICLATGISIYIALAAPAFVAIVVQDIPLQVLVQQMFNSLDKFALMAIPFFILGANIMGKGGLAKSILDVAQIIAGKYYGGTAIATVLACLFFGSLCGSSPATVVAIGALVYPGLLEAGYSKKFSIGLVTSASSLALIIPPSITMIVYGSVTGASVGALFMGGFGPGIFTGIILAIYSYWFARKNDIKIKTEYTRAEKIKTLKHSSWAFGVPILIIGGIYGGIFTPTESATVSAMYAIFISMFIYKKMNLQDLLKCCLDSAVTTAQIMMMVAATGTLSWVFTVGQLPQLLNTVMGPYLTSGIITMLLILLVLIIAGMFMDASPYVLLLAPLFIPFAAQVGVNPVHLGIIMVLAGCLGMFTPPFGLNIYVGMSVYKEKFATVAMAGIPFIVIFIFCLLVTTFWPDLAMWLPSKVYPSILN